MKALIRILVVAVGLVAVSSFANTFSFSYTLLKGPYSASDVFVSGTLEGDLSADGKYVENVRDVTLVLNNTPVTGTIFTYTMTTVDGSGIWVSGPQVAFEGINNNFLFCDDVDRYKAHHYFMLRPAGWGMDSIAAAYQDPTTWANIPIENRNWSLTLASVPEGGLTITLLGLALGGLGYLRRRI